MSIWTRLARPPLLRDELLTNEFYMGEQYSLFSMTDMLKINSFYHFTLYIVHIYVQNETILSRCTFTNYYQMRTCFHRRLLGILSDNSH